MYKIEGSGQAKQGKHMGQERRGEGRGERVKKEFWREGGKE